MTRVVAIVQARTGSTRLPGKVLLDVAGKPLLARVLDRARAIAGVDDVAVATTTDPRDRPLLRLAETVGVQAFAGSEHDVLDRYYRAAQALAADVIIRLTADCPLLDPRVSALVLSTLWAEGADYASNTQPPTFPDGLDTEVFSFDVLERAWRKATLLSEREHVTPYIWTRPLQFRLANVAAARDLSHLRWTVDDDADLRLIRRIYEHLPIKCTQRNDFGHETVLALLAANPSWSALNAHTHRNEGLERSRAQDTRRVPALSPHA